MKWVLGRTPWLGSGWNHWNIKGFMSEPFYQVEPLTDGSSYSILGCRWNPWNKMGSRKNHQGWILVGTHRWKGSGQNLLKRGPGLNHYSREGFSAGTLRPLCGWNLSHMVHWITLYVGFPGRTLWKGFQVKGSIRNPNGFSQQSKVLQHWDPMISEGTRPCKPSTWPVCRTTIYTRMISSNIKRFVLRESRPPRGGEGGLSFLISINVLFVLRVSLLLFSDSYTEHTSHSPAQETCPRYWLMVPGFFQMKSQ